MILKTPGCPILTENLKFELTNQNNKQGQFHELRVQIHGFKNQESCVLHFHHFIDTGSARNKLSEVTIPPVFAIVSSYCFFSEIHDSP